MQEIHALSTKPIFIFVVDSPIKQFKTKNPLSTIYFALIQKVQKARSILVRLIQ